MGELKFEVGQRWRRKASTKMDIVLHSRTECARQWRYFEDGRDLFADEPTLAAFWELAAPAPRPGQTWAVGDRREDLRACPGECLEGFGATCTRYTMARWLRDRGAEYVGEETAPCIGPLRALADVVVEAFIPSQNQRRCVDELSRYLHGEPVAPAIRAVLAFVVEPGGWLSTCISPSGLLAIVSGCRAWERRRVEIAGGRVLTTEQEIECGAAAVGAAMDAGGAWPAGAAQIYERVRATC